MDSKYLPHILLVVFLLVMGIYGFPYLLARSNTPLIVPLSFYYTNSSDPKPQIAIGLRHLHGNGTPRDVPKAIEWLERAAANNSTDALMELGNAYSNFASPPQIDKAISYYLKAAEQGNDTAYRHIGMIYYNERLIPEDLPKAVSYFEKVVDTLYPSTKQYIGHNYYYGNRNLPKDYSKAFYWLSLAAKDPNHNETSLLAYMYYKGQGTVKDDNKAFQLYIRDLPNEDSETYYWLARMYEEGSGTLKDSHQAISYYSKAIKQNDNDEIIALSYDQIAGIFYKGTGDIPKDRDKAITLYRVAADKGSRYAQHMLAYCYFHGYSLPKNRAEAYYWAAVAQRNGSTGAAAFLPRIARQLTPQQREALDRRAAAWQPSLIKKKG